MYFPQHNGLYLHKFIGSLKSQSQDWEMPTNTVSAFKNSCVVSDTTPRIKGDFRL